MGTCVLLEIDRYRENATASAQVMLSDKGKDDIATESRSKVLYHLVKNPGPSGISVGDRLRENASSPRSPAPCSTPNSTSMCSA